MVADGFRRPVTVRLRRGALGELRGVDPQLTKLSSCALPASTRYPTEKHGKRACTAYGILPTGRAAATIGIVAAIWFYSDAARADLISITATGNITSESQGTVSIIGQPFTLTTTFDPTAVSTGPVPGVQYFDSGSTTFTSGAYTGIAGYPNVQYELNSGFTWAPMTGLSVDTEWFGGISSGAAPTTTSIISNFPYPARAGCATVAGSRRMRLAPSGRVPALS
jgi:hypothetical protein